MAAAVRAKLMCSVWVQIPQMAKNNKQAKNQNTSPTTTSSTTSTTTLNFVMTIFTIYKLYSSVLFTYRCTNTHTFVGIQTTLKVSSCFTNTFIHPSHLLLNNHLWLQEIS